MSRTKIRSGSHFYANLINLCIDEEKNFMFLKKDCILLPESFGNRAIGINADMASTVSDICH